MTNIDSQFSLLFTSIPFLIGLTYSLLLLIKHLKANNTQRWEH